MPTIEYAMLALHNMYCTSVQSSVRNEHPVALPLGVPQVRRGPKSSGWIMYITLLG